MAEGTKGDEFALVSDRDRRSREGVSCDGLVKDAKSGCEAPILIFEGRNGSGMDRMEIQKNGPRLPL